MDHQKVAPLVCCLLLVGCASVSSQVERVVWKAQREMRTPGETLLAFPEAVWRDYNCGQRRLPFLKVEENSVLPPKLRPGEELSHRLVYAMCPAVPAQVAAGNLYTRIYFKGKPLVTDIAKGFEIKSGRWRVDTFITVPPDAAPGLYSVEVQFDAQGVSLRETRSFVVESGTG